MDGLTDFSPKQTDLLAVGLVGLWWFSPRQIALLALGRVRCALKIVIIVLLNNLRFCLSLLSFALLWLSDLEFGGAGFADSWKSWMAGCLRTESQSSTLAVDLQLSSGAQGVELKYWRGVLWSAERRSSATSASRSTLW